MRNVEIASGEYYHVFNRSVEGIQIFNNVNDYWRFQALLFFCNLRGAKLPVKISRFCGSTLSVAQRREVAVMNREYERHVRICVYNTMPNHFHIKLMPNFEDGCEKFMHKLEMAYSKYCNPKLQRKGRLFQGTYEAVHVTNDFQWFHLSNYIHGNSLDLCMPEWRDGLVKDWEQARAFLQQHLWSSLPTFLGVPERFPILDSEYKRQRFEKTEDVLRELEEWSRRGIQIHDIPGIEFE